jgi:hypothetical protein
LKFVWEKATFPDDWSYTGEEERPWGINLPRGEIDFEYDGKGPHPWWDQYSSAPMLNSSYKKNRRTERQGCRNGYGQRVSKLPLLRRSRLI